MADKQASLIITLKDLVSKPLAAIGSQMDKLGKQFRDAGILFGGISGAISLIGTMALKASGQMEQWRIAFTTMLGSADRAEILLNKIRAFAAATPFELPQVIEGAKRLMAYGSSAEEVLIQLKALGDVAAGVGMDKLPNLILAFGQVQTATRLMGTELRQFSEAGVPMIAALADHFGVADEEIRKMVEDGKVGFKDVQAAIIKMTSSGGQFGDMMKAQSLSLFGNLSNLKDSVFVLADSFGQVLLPVAKQIVAEGRRMVDWAMNLPVQTKILIAIVAAATAAFTGLLAAVSGLVILAPAIAAAWAIITGPVGALIFTVGALSALFYVLRDDVTIIATFIWEKFVELQGLLEQWFTWFFEKLTFLTEWFSSLLPDSVAAGFEKVKQSMEALKNKAGEVFKNITDPAKARWEDLKNKVHELLGDMQGKLQNFYNTDSAAHEDYQKKKTGIEQREVDARIAREIKRHQMENQLNQQQAQNFAQTMDFIASMSTSNNKTLATVGKAAALIRAKINIAEGITRALASAPPPINIGLAAITAAAGAVQMAQIAGVKFAKGGLVMPTAGGTHAIIGEAGKREAVIPLDDPEAKQAIAEGLGGGGLTIQINAGVIVGGEDQVKELAKMIDQEMFNLRRNNLSVAFDPL